MNDDFEFLEFIHNNARVGQETIARIIKTRDVKDDFEIVLREIIQNYKRIGLSAQNMIERRKKEIKELSIISRVATYMAIKSNLDGNSTREEIVKMIKQNLCGDIEEIEKRKSDYKIKSKTILNLADRFIEAERENIEKIKKIS